MTQTQHKAPPAGLAGTVDHLDAGDGWLLARLMTKQAFVREGAHMDHCLGDAMHFHLAGEEELTGDAIWSLRDPEGVSWVTLEILEGHNEGAAPRLSHVTMAKGPGNRTVRRSVARRLQALVAAFRAAGRELDFNVETGLVMADDGRVMREDQAPAEVREQARERHIARVVRPWCPTPEQGEPRHVRVEIAQALAEALHGATGMPVYEWCQRELRIEEPAVRIEATVDAPLQVRSLTLDDYVRHIQRSSTQVFMGLDTQDIREAEAPPQERTYAAAVRMLRGRAGGYPGGGGDGSPR